MRLITIWQARRPRRLDGGLSAARVAATVFLCAVFVLGAGEGEARPAGSDQVTISMLVNSTTQPGYSVLISNFERVYPNITVNVTYSASNTQLFELEMTELAAGNGPDLLATYPGCGLPISVCELVNAGDLAPLVGEPWTRRSLPLVISLSKHDQALYAFELNVSPIGVFTNDSLFSRLGLRVPETFSELLDVCQKAKADGTVGVLLAGANATSIQLLVTDLAAATLYGKDSHWTSELKAGRVTFDGTSGWHEALQEFVDMNNAGCFEPGAAGSASVTAQFAQGQGLMMSGNSSSKGVLDAASPQFSYSFHPFPGGTDSNRTSTFLNLGTSLGVNARSSVQNQAAARTFIDFIARPKQNALYAETQGSLTQYEFLKGQIPAFMSDFATVFNQHHYVINPAMTWWNANVVLALQQDTIGLITGQSTIDDVLNAMDVAWKQGPS